MCSQVKHTVSTNNRLDCKYSASKYKFLVSSALKMTDICSCENMKNMKKKIFGGGVCIHCHGA